MRQRKQDLSAKLAKGLDELDMLRAGLHGLQRNIQEIKKELEARDRGHGKSRPPDSPAKSKHR